MAAAMRKSRLLPVSMAADATASIASVNATPVHEMLWRTRWETNARNRRKSATGADYGMPPRAGGKRGLPARPGPGTKPARLTAVRVGGVWLGRRDSNPDTQIQSLQSYR